MSNVRSVLFLAFPQVSEQDLYAAWELMRAVAYGNPGLDISIGSFQGEALPTHMGSTIAPQRIIKDSDRFDVLYIPGGIGAGAASKDSRVLELIRAHHAEGRWVAANCAGVGVLYRAGVLDGKQITSPASLARRLPQLGANLVSPRRAWKVDRENRIFTAGGAATVHPSTIALVGELFGIDAAKNLAGSWDTWALHGDVLFQPLGPKMLQDTEAERALQDQLELVFLPG
ncbi:TPA: DJ-1/PfpI family protein [Pseudomonas aeruginosa]|nr:DJ-1/PfpI family protein [Pseudomonas aeruginosa]HEH8432078.1 DJ-1/PfpI family protein [Pseudomonas aeruginosa]HEH8533629.1 DJ-1/PfpI family protein [Pseudomonas aeruginosa]HEH8759656.1 DJ-1/PfpI family protein [Pseudomonas aeruginosa]